MSKVLVEIEVPDVVKGTLLEQKLRDVVARRTLEQGVIDLYKQREISTGTGAKMLGLSLQEFIHFLGEHDVSIFAFTDEEWQAELQNAERVTKQISSD